MDRPRPASSRQAVGKRRVRDGARRGDADLQCERNADAPARSDPVYWLQLWRAALLVRVPQMRVPGCDAVPAQSRLWLPSVLPHRLRQSELGRVWREQSKAEAKLADNWQRPKGCTGQRVSGCWRRSSTARNGARRRWPNFWCDSGDRCKVSPAVDRVLLAYHRGEFVSDRAARGMYERFRRSA